MNEERAKEIMAEAEKMAAADERQMVVFDEAAKIDPSIWSQTLRHPTFVHEMGSPARWEQVVDMVYQDRRRLMQRGRECMPTAVMIDREERRHAIAWLRKSDPRHTGYFEHGMQRPEPGGDDLLFNMPVFWAASGSMRGMTVRVLTDHSQRS